MHLNNPRKYSQKQICDVLKEDFNDYLNNPAIIRTYKYSMVNNDKIEIAVIPAETLVFTLLIRENSVEIIPEHADGQALAEINSFLSRRLHISREKF